MSTLERTESKESQLNDSWVEVGSSRGSTPPLFPRINMTNEQMEKMLLEAQKELSRHTSINASTISSRTSPKSPHSPVSDPTQTKTVQEFENSDWIWDWSSRPEIKPPSSDIQSNKYKHFPRSETGKSKRHGLSVRNTGIISNLPALLFTHAATFILGAAA
ncbi:DgyrCDS11795 [Dimorphilus gyrociliatus]|uniref:DgyrCDS11795 n=1 Tax=Dimorphilus gyrociliatus TaxID=2664684 RepID=A0A7I8W5T0_9ANNE|nr:DgyrCDS11795 [Dimorphilus gyrociliatus]